LRRRYTKKVIQETIILKLFKNAGFLFGAVFAVVIGGDWLLYGWPVGWNLALGVLLGLVMIGMRNVPALSNRATLALGLAVLGLAIAMCEQPTVVGTVLAVLGLGTLALVARGGIAPTLTAWVVSWLRLPDHLLLRPLKDAAIATKWFYRHPTAEPRVVRWTLVWVIPLGLGGVFLAIFAVANPIIAQWAHAVWEGIYRILASLPEWLLPGRVAFWIFLGISTYGLLRERRRKQRAPAIRVPPRYPLPDAKPLMIVRCLAVFNLIFAVQTLLDVVYLWGGAALPKGMTYATYAHRGSYALIVAALLAAVFVIATFRPRGAAERFAWARRLVYLWIAQNVFLTFAAAWRLKLYVDVYTLTRLRVAAGIWMLIVAVGLGLIVWRILRRRSNVWLLRANVCTVAIVLYGCAFCNFSGTIASFNVTHCGEVTGHGASLDTAYLRDLGPDALPAIRWAQDHVTDETLLAGLRQSQATLEESLAADLSNWRGWTWRRQRLAADSRVSVAHAGSPSRRIVGWRWSM
jgi:hypothetical protein